MSATPSNFTEYDFANENEEDVEETQKVSPFDIPIEELIERRDRYINELKLEKAQEIDAIIDYIQNTAHEGPVQKVKDYLENKFIEYYNQYKENCKKLQETANDNEVEIRKDGDDVFVEMKAKHIGQLIEIEKMRAYEIIFNRNKPVKKALIYEQQARYSAKQKEYDKAYAFRQQASLEKERVHNERKQLVEEKISNLKSNVLSAMRSEMKVLVEKIQDQIKSNQASLNKDLDLQLKAFKVQVNSEIQKAINGLNNYITKNETKRTLANEISAFSDSKLKEITGMEMSIAISSPPSPPNQKSRSQTVSPTPTKSSTQTRNSTRQTTPRKEKQRKQQSSPKPQEEEENQAMNQEEEENQTINQEEVQNQINQEEENQINQEEVQNQQQEQEQPNEEQEIEQLTEENKELQNQLNAIDTNEKEDDFNLDNLDNLDDENYQVDNNFLNENSNNLDDGNANENEAGAGSDKKSDADPILSNLLNDDNEFLDILGEGNNSKIDGSSDILNFGED